MIKINIDYVTKARQTFIVTSHAFIGNNTDIYQLNTFDKKIIYIPIRNILLVEAEAINETP